MARAMLTAGTLLLALSRPAAADCVHGVRVVGDAGLAARLRATLGADQLPRPACRAAEAQATAVGGAIRVTLWTTSGTYAARTFTTDAAAAAWIATWLRHDLVLDLVGPPPRRPTPEPPAFTVALFGALSLSPDGEAWVGANVAACATLGFLCLGGLARFDQDIANVETAPEVDTRRSSIDVLGLAEVPVRWGPVVVRPGLTGGVGFVESTFDEEEDRYFDPSHPGIERRGLRLGAHALVSFPVSESVAVVGGLLFDLLPNAHTADSCYARDPADGPCVRFIHGEPLYFGRVAVGVRAGAP